MRQRLERWLAGRLPEAAGVRVRALERSTEGFSQETFFFEASWTQGGTRTEHAYVAKREPAAGLLEPYDLEPEFRVLHALSDDPLPSPPTPWFERDPSVLERPFYVMERLPGTVPIPAPHADGAPPFDEAQRSALAPQVIAALARLHSLDWRKLGLEFLGVPGSGRAAALRELARWRGRIERSGFAPPPVVTEALGWLRRTAPAARAITLVHGDFRLGNWLVQANEGRRFLSGLLDWEMVHLGDPVEDLAWCISPMWRARTPWAAALLPAEQFVARYAREGEREVDAETLLWYAILSVVKMIAIELTGIRAFLDGRTADLRMAIFDHQLPFLCALLAVLRGWLPEPGAGGA